MDTVKVNRFGLENAPEDYNDVRLCEECAHGFGWYERRDGNHHDGEYDGYLLFWLTDANSEESQCEECGVYGGHCEECRQHPEDCECAELWEVLYS